MLKFKKFVIVKSHIHTDHFTFH